MYLVIGCGSAGASLAQEFRRSCSPAQRSLFKPVFIDSAQGSDKEASIFISSSLQDFRNLSYARRKNSPAIHRGNSARDMEDVDTESREYGLGRKFEDGWTFFRNNRGIIFEDIIRHARLKDVSEVKLALIFYSLAGVTGGGGSPMLGEIFKENNIPAIGIAVVPAEAEGEMAGCNALKSLSKSLESMDAVILADNELLRGEDFSNPSESLHNGYNKLNSFVAKSMRDLVLGPSTFDKIENLEEARTLDFTDIVSSLNLGGIDGTEKGVGVIGRVTISLRFWGGIREERPYRWIELLEQQLSVNLNNGFEAGKIQRAAGTVLLHNSLVRKFPFKDFEQALASLTGLNCVSMAYAKSARLSLSITLLFSLHPGHVSSLWRINPITRSIAEKDKESAIPASPFKGIFTLDENRQADSRLSPAGSTGL